MQLPDNFPNEEELKEICQAIDDRIGGLPWALTIDLTGRDMEIRPVVVSGTFGDHGDDKGTSTYLSALLASAAMNLISGNGTTERLDTNPAVEVSAEEWQASREKREKAIERTFNETHEAAEALRRQHGEPSVPMVPPGFPSGLIGGAMIMTGEEAEQMSRLLYWGRPK